jgi:excisionase family DNA binding protein
MNESTITHWYTITQLANQIEMSRKTVWAWVRDGKLGSHRYGAQHRVYETDWQQFLARCNNGRLSVIQNPFAKAYQHDNSCPKCGKRLVLAEYETHYPITRRRAFLRVLACPTPCNYLATEERRLP